ncbi:Endoplasmic reticulum-based factor for assembly of V-ATPase [Cryptosporidium felis]|nr:Endoplasmic reticulum-based factor for assembly of V-ATPase [Cryptosporidium felis]
MKVSITPELKEFFLKFGENSFNDSENIDVDSLYKAYSKVVKEYHSANKENGGNLENRGELPSLQELLLKSKKEAEYSKKLTPNDQKLSIIEILRKRSEERRYQSSIKNLSQAKYTRTANNVPDAFGVHYSRDILMSMNALIGLVLTFIGGFYAPLYMGLEDFNTRIFIGIGCSILCLIAEVGLLIIYDLKRNMKISKIAKKDPILNYLNNKEKGLSSNIYKNQRNARAKTPRLKKGKKHKAD